MAILPKLSGVVGAGQMGRGIAQALATSGLRVLLVDESKEQLQHAQALIAQSVEKMATRGTVLEDPSEVLRRIREQPSRRWVVQTLSWRLCPRRQN
jgi:3-hydroxyacyl-CoA dehydrogenase